MNCHTFLQLEKLITPEHFAEIMCVDLDLPSSEFVSVIADSIRKQVQENEMMTDCNPPKDDSRVLINVCINQFYCLILIEPF